MSVIAVTGATGRIGGALVDRLSSAGAHVRAGVRDLENARVPDGVERAPLDLSDTASIAAFLAGVDRLFVLTPLVPEMVELTRAVASVLPASGVSQVVRLSTLAADPLSPVTVIRWHGQAEDALRATNIPVAIVRPNAFMQNYLMVAPAIRAERVFRRNDDLACVSLVDVRDVAAVGAALLSADGPSDRVYDVTGPVGLTNVDVASTISGIIGADVRYEAVSDDTARAAMVANGMADWLVDAMVELHIHRRRGGFDWTSSVVADVVGRPPTSFGQFVEDHAAAFGADDGGS